MTLITFQDGRAVMRDGKVGTEQDCCCKQCDLSLSNQSTQPNVSVTTDCECNGGTLNGDYAFIGAGMFGGASWSGTTTCDWTGLPSAAPIDISVSSDCVVTVSTYQYPFESLQGVATASNLTLDQDGYIVGSIAVPLENLGGVLKCTATVTFGP